MKNFKKVLSLALAALMVIGGLAVAPVNTNAADATYTRVTSVDEIKAGGNFVIVAEHDGYHALGTTISSKINGVSVTVTDGVLSGDNIPVWTIAASDNGISISNGSNYLAYAGSGTNFASTDTVSDTKAEWTVTLGADGGFRFTNVSVTGRGIGYQYESNGTTYDRFGGYATSNDKDDSGYVFGFIVYKASSSTATTPSEGNETDAKDPTGLSQEEIVKLAYTLKSGESLSKETALTGVIKSVDEEYSETYGNITVTIQVGDLADKQIKCFRLKGDGAATLAVGNTITVTGTITNYAGTIEFGSGCTLDKIVDSSAIIVDKDVPENATAKEIVELAYTLQSGAKLTSSVTLTGVIKTIDTAYDADYKNITVTIQVGDLTDKLIQCFRMKGDGADKLAVGDTITVTGTIKNYGGTIEFDAGCTFVTAGDTTTTTPGGDDSDKEEEKETTTTTTMTATEIMAAAEALESGESLEGTYELQGIITEIGEYNATYGDVSLTIKVNGTDKTIYCYAVKGDGNDALKVGDEIRVSGTITNYNGTIEFNKPTLVPIETKGDMAMPVALILFAGCALVTVAVVSKKRMA